MITKPEFIERELMPIAGDYVDDYDWEAICDEVSDFDATRGYVWRADIAADLEDLGYSEKISSVLQAHDISEEK